MIQKMMIPHGTIADKGRAGTHENVDIVKGEVRRIFFYWLKVFIGLKLRQVSKGNFHRKEARLFGKARCPDGAE